MFPSLAMAREPFLGGNSMWLSNKSERIVAKDKISLHRLGKSWSRSHARPYCLVYLFTLIILSLMFLLVSMAKLSVNALSTSHLK